MDLIVLSNSFGVFMNTKEGFKKLEGFSKLDFGAFSESYIRKYISAQGKSTDIVSSECEISYSFDRMKNNSVHDCLAHISDLGKKGKDCIKEFILVDFSKEFEEGFCAVLQSFCIQSKDKRHEQGFLDYSGVLISTGEPQKGYAVLIDEKNARFIPERRGILCD